MNLLELLATAILNDRGLRKRLATFLVSRSVAAVETDTWHNLLNKLSAISQGGVSDEPIIRQLTQAVLQDILQLTLTNVIPDNVLNEYLTELTALQDEYEFVVDDEQFDANVFADNAALILYSFVNLFFSADCTLIDQAVIDFPNNQIETSNFIDVLQTALIDITANLLQTTTSDATQIVDVPSAVISDKFTTSNVSFIDALQTALIDITANLLQTTTSDATQIVDVPSAVISDKFTTNNVSFQDTVTLKLLDMPPE
ncbi:MAG: hypothetical protein LBP59_11000 [Planctomycetaceae bacterium]|jgi:hypothetical protein|nr:hypothetical protein [Planctomycetaceae bacterium]